MANETPHRWSPLSLEQVADLFRGFHGHWWLAGGYAIEAFVGRHIREHGDIDILVRRDEQLLVQEHLRDWDIHYGARPGLAPWRQGQFLDERYHDIWCRRTPGDPWSVQLMLLDTSEGKWIYRRDPEICGNISQLGYRSSDGIPCLSPHIQLLYKAKSETIPKDQTDFEAATPLMSQSAQAWLLTSLRRRFPEDHPWVAALRKLLESGPFHHEVAK